MPKKRSSAQNKLSLYFYIFIHLAVLLCFAFKVLHAGQLSIQADLFSMMPNVSFNSSENSFSDQAAKQKAEHLLAEKTSENVIVLVSSKDFSKAKLTAQTVGELPEKWG